MDAKTFPNPATSLDRGTSIETSSRPVFRLAQSIDDREGAFRLLHRAYVRAELAEPNRHGLRVSPYQLLRTSPMFITELRQEVVATVTLAIDGEMGLPVEEVYPDAIRNLRRFNAKCAEMCCLADRRKDPERGIEALIEMTRLAFYYALKEGVTCLLLIAHPRHGKFYKRAMGFRAFDEIRTCPYVRNQPAEPLLLNIPELAYNRPKLYDRYLGKAVAPERLLTDPISSDQVAYFQQYL